MPTARTVLVWRCCRMAMCIKVSSMQMSVCVVCQWMVAVVQIALILKSVFNSLDLDRLIVWWRCVVRNQADLHAKHQCMSSHRSRTLTEVYHWVIIPCVATRRCRVVWLSRGGVGPVSDLEWFFPLKWCVLLRHICGYRTNGLPLQSYLPQMKKFT